MIMMAWIESQSVEKPSMPSAPTDNSAKPKHTIVCPACAGSGIKNGQCDRCVGDGWIYYDE